MSRLPDVSNPLATFWPVTFSEKPANSKAWCLAFPRNGRFALFRYRPAKRGRRGTPARSSSAWPTGGIHASAASIISSVLLLSLPELWARRGLLFLWLFISSLCSLSISMTGDDANAGTLGSDKAPETGRPASLRNLLERFAPKGLLRLSRNHQTPWLCFLLFLLVAGGFLPSIHNGFVNFDDQDYVTANPHVQGGLTWAGLRWALT